MNIINTKKNTHHIDDQDRKDQMFCGNFVIGLQKVTDSKVRSLLVGIISMIENLVKDYKWYISGRYCQLVPLISTGEVVAP